VREYCLKKARGESFVH